MRFYVLQFTHFTHSVSFILFISTCERICWKQLNSMFIAYIYFYRHIFVCFFYFCTALSVCCFCKNDTYFSYFHFSFHSAQCLLCCFILNEANRIDKDNTKTKWKMKCVWWDFSMLFHISFAYFSFNPCVFRCIMNCLFLYALIKCHRWQSSKIFSFVVVNILCIPLNCFGICFRL